jgi:hypothetical protein
VAFAYAGAALPVLVIIAVTDPAWLDALTSSKIAEEVVRTAIGGACVALSVPVTTAVAAAAVAGASVAPTGAPGTGTPGPEEARPPAALPGRRAQREAERSGRRGRR